MTWRCRAGLLFAIALLLSCEATAQSALEVVAKPAWSGWSGSGRGTEIDVRVRGGFATRAIVSVAAGVQSVRSAVDLQPGRAARLHVPISSEESIDVRVALPDAPVSHREVRIAHSELPLLALAVVSNDQVVVEGFHTITLGADDLPRNASAYSSIAALIVDRPTLVALDERQLAALLAHVAACGRTVLVDGGQSAQSVFENGAGCSGQFLMTASSLTRAADVLRASLAVPAEGAVSLAALGDLARPDHSVWNRILVLVAVYFGAAMFAMMFSLSIRLSLAVSAAATALSWLTLYVIQPKPQLLVWSEAKSGARLVQYDAWQQVSGVARTSVRLTLLSQLGAARPCDISRPIHFDLDANRGLLTAAEFDVRLFQQIALCYSGNFPVMRGIAVDVRPDGALHVRNTGTTAWPAGTLVSGYFVYDLPPLAPGANVTFAEHEGKIAEGAVLRTALARAPGNGAAALWPLNLAGVANVPDMAAAWLLVSSSTP